MKRFGTRFWLAFLGLCGVACGGQIDDSAAHPGTVGGHAASNPSSLEGGAPQQVGTHWSGNASGLVGGQSLTLQQFGGFSQSGSVSGGPVKLKPISQEEANLIRSNTCSSYLNENEQPVLQLEWLVDASGSQAELVQGTNQSKWDLSRELVLEANEQLAARGKCAAGCIGLLAFPLRNTDALTAQPAESLASCIDFSQRVESMCSGDWSSLDQSSMQERLGSIVPAGGTPLLDAYRYTVRQFAAQGRADSSYVVLVTDGMPSIDSDCRLPNTGSAAATSTWTTLRSDDNLVAQTDPILDEIARAHSQGIRTVVVGTSSEPASRAWLSRAATAGGTAWIRCNGNDAIPYCHLDLLENPNIASTIARALLPTRSVVSCRSAITVDGVAGDLLPIDAHQIVPIIRTADPNRLWSVPLDDGPAETCSEGFRVISPREVELCPAACSLLSRECMATLEVDTLCAGGRF